MLICICDVGMIWLTRRRLWISGHLVVGLVRKSKELRGSPETLLREITVAKL
jgi:hypothetical protein